MGDKRVKLAHGLTNITPLSVNFSELQTEYDERETEFDASDNGLEQRRMEDNIEYEELIIQILCNLEPREKLIFVYQLLRDGGYKIDHTAFAKTVNLSRTQFMRVLQTVRTKSLLYVMGYEGKLGQKDTKTAPLR